ncbi:MAG: group 1 truncated hemoglobin [Rhizonema sp. PD37]|nr:group 1 truncated hemoglobin [Rhizonema sp. PD37]
MNSIIEELLFPIIVESASSRLRAIATDKKLRTTFQYTNHAIAAVYNQLVLTALATAITYFYEQTWRRDFTMKVTGLLRRTFFLGLAFTAVAILTVFKSSPSFAYSTSSSIIPPTYRTGAINLIASYNSSVSDSLYKRLGYYNGIAKVIDDVSQYIENDPLIGKYLIGLSTNSKQRLRQLLVEQFCQAAGGSCIYTGRTMKLSHSGIGGGLTNEEFDAYYQDVAKVLDKNNVELSAKDEVLTFINSLRGEIVER